MIRRVPARRHHAHRDGGQTQKGPNRVPAKRLAIRALVSTFVEGACLVTVSGLIPRNDSLDGMGFDSPALRT